VTIWIHPFINIDCPSFQTAFDRGYFVKDQKSIFGMASWWQGSNAGLIDFTNDEAVEWWSSRLERLRAVYGIDSFKFDGGDMSGLPYSHQLAGDVNLGPSIATTKYVEAVAIFGNMVEVRVGRRNQKEGIFTRMLDKYSGWGYDNGLQSVIPTLLHFGLKGYPFIMPDMVGGNAYEESPNRELYIRWLQANAFMPSLQLSILPWNYDDEVVRIVKSILDIRNKYADKIIAAAKQSTVDGSPINRPMWWVSPRDSDSFTMDDQYMVGDDIVVAPVLKEGATSRNIYLPTGYWNATVNGTVVGYCMSGYLVDFPAPLDTLPFFVRDRDCEINDCGC
jgi:alpha-glucosidase (family GH31 glycosyl hydrolase)